MSLVTPAAAQAAFHEDLGENQRIFVDRDRPRLTDLSGSG
jgi:hypothetical protein